MSEKLNISYHTAKSILLELLQNKEILIDEDILKILVSMVHKETSDINNDEVKLSRILIDKEVHIFMPDFSSKEVKIPYLPKTVFIFFLIHKEGIEFKSMYNYVQELYEIYQIVAFEKNMEASRIRKSMENLVEPVNNRIYEICSIIRQQVSQIIPASVADLYCVTGKRGEKRQINIDRSLIVVENVKLKEIFDLRNTIE